MSWSFRPILGLAAVAAVLAVGAAFGPPAFAQAAGAASQGPVVHWNLEAQEFQRPSAAAVAVLLEELQQMMAERFAAGDGVLSPADKVTAETLANGVRRVRLPADRLNVSVVRVGAAGELSKLCAETPRQVHELLSRPAPSSPEEE